MDPISKLIESSRPTKEEEKKVILVSKEALSNISKVLPKGVKAEIMGSVAKNTFVSGKPDIDIFLIFDKKFSREYANSVLQKVVDEVFSGNAEFKYAKHRYARVFYKGYRIDVVPAFSITFEEKPLSDVDRTLLHVKFVNSRLDDSLRDQVRALKFFLKLHRLYGSEISVCGFSGYLCELLIIKFGSFMEVMHSASTWEVGHRISLSSGPFPSFDGDALIFPDPVDSSRNAAAAVSVENLKKLSILASLVVSGSESVFKANFFSPKRSRILSSLPRIDLILSYDPSISEDIIWGQARSAGKKAFKLLSSLGFQPVELFLDIPNKRVSIFCLLRNAPMARIVYGPPGSRGLSEFAKSHENDRIFIYNNRPAVLRSPRAVSLHSAKELIASELDSRYSKVSFKVEVNNL